MHRLALLSLVACARANPPATLENRRAPVENQAVEQGPTDRACKSPIAMIEITIIDDVGVAHDFCTSIWQSLEHHGRSLVPRATLQLAIAFKEIVKDGDLDLKCRLAAEISTTSDQIIASTDDAAKVRATSPRDVERAMNECIVRAIDSLFERHVVPAIAHHWRP